MRKIKHKLDSKGTKEKIIELFFTEHLRPVDIAKKLKVSTDFLLYGDSSNVIGDNELASLLNGLSSMELERAKNVLKAVFI